MTVGVAISSYKYGMYLANCLDSVFAQTKKPDQIIVVDDASDDGGLTKHIADMWGVECIVREKNMGTRDNFQDILVNHMKTDLMFFLGADNWLHPQYIERTYEQINDRVKLVGTNTYIVGEFGNMVCHIAPDWYNDSRDLPMWDYKEKNLEYDNWIHGSALFDRKIAIELGGFYPSVVTQLSDHDMWRAFYKAGWEVRKSDLPLLYYRKHRFNFNQSEVKLGIEQRGQK
jgi:glycosyltransferase involved in cell wall biosynthesis